jgi:autoinducer 2-degrading protein
MERLPPLTYVRSPPHPSRCLQLDRKGASAALSPCLSPPPRYHKLSMLILHVHMQVKPAHLDAFKAATIENAYNSRKEPGVVRFDLFQQSDDPTRFLLHEVYRDAAAQASHKETPHYKTWVDKVGDLFAEPRTRQSYTPVYPPEAEW